MCDAPYLHHILSDMLPQTELLDSFTEGSPVELPGPSDSDKIGFHNASFAWSKEQTRESSSPSRRNFILNVEGDIFFSKNAFNLIVGPTGSGKSSLLLALLGELHFIPCVPGAWFNLPREGGISYAAQEPWIQNTTIKVNSYLCHFGARLKIHPVQHCLQ